MSSVLTLYERNQTKLHRHDLCQLSLGERWGGRGDVCTFGTMDFIIHIEYDIERRTYSV